MRSRIIQAPNKIDNQHLSVLDSKSTMALGRGGVTEEVHARRAKRESGV